MIKIMKLILQSFDNKTTALYQVCFDLTDEETQTREVRSLIKAGRRLNCQNLNLVTLEKPETYILPQEIKIISAAEIMQ